MKSVGELLQSERIKKKKTLENIANSTSISIGQLEAIENNSFDVFPNRVTALGFVTLFAQALDIAPQTIAAVFRRDVHADAVQKPSTFRFFFTRRHTMIRMQFLFLSIVIIGFLLYSIFSLTALSSPPYLAIQTPKDGALITSPLTIKGKTSSDALVQIDGAAVTLDQDGGFVLQRDIEPGPAMIRVESISRAGKKRTVLLRVVVRE